MWAPERKSPEDLAGYLEVLTKAVFQAGLNWKVIEAKWGGFCEAFAGFDPETVASFSPEDVERLMADTRIVRNRRKVEATVENARTMLAVEHEYGDFGRYLASLGDFEAAGADLKRRFRHLGDMGVYFFLYVVGFEVPKHEDWAARHDHAHSARRPSGSAGRKRAAM